MQFLVLLVYSVSLLASGVDADLKKCQDIKNKFLTCTTKWVLSNTKQSTSLSRNMKNYSIHNQCNFEALTLHDRAHDTFKEQIAIGKDGRPDFAARKACNYMETAIQVYLTLRASLSITTDGCSLSDSRYELWKIFRCSLLISEKSFQTCGDSLEGECFTHKEVDLF